MLLTAEYLKSVIDKAVPYNDYVAGGTEEQQRRWQQVFDAAYITGEQQELINSFTREMNVLVISGIWCGDCVEQGPLLARIEQASLGIHLRFVDRDDVPELYKNVTINQGKRVPIVLFLAEDYAFCGIYGDRSLIRYRAIAQRQLAPACSTGLFIPDAEELAGTLQDWLNETERIQLMLRLSTRLREKHQD